MLNSVSSWNLDYTTYNYSGSYMPITGNTFNVKNNLNLNQEKVTNLHNINIINYGSGVYY